MATVTEKIDGVTLVPAQSDPLLNERQREDYRMHRKEMLEWLLNVGKDPDKAEGYAQQTVQARAYRIDVFYRWIWTELHDGYTTTITHEHADEYMQHIAYTDHSNAHKANVMKALKMLFKWRHHQLGDESWEPEMTFSHTDSTSQPRDYFTREERAKLREVALEYGSIPHYNAVDPAERDEWKAHLAQRFEKPKDAVGREDWERANSWKIPSLVWVSLDTGLRPIEVERSVVSWVDTDNGVLRIPKEESSKNRDNWIVGLRSRTARALEKWLEEREHYDMYDDTDAIWLTRNGNPYDANALRYLAHRLCEEADIDTEDRKISWYTIRHSVGTYMTHEEDLAAAQAQLRHKSERTTMRYDQAPVEERKKALDRMG